ncbi:MAG: recombinase RecT [Candidatus Symbiothrix sp.]|jgi:recombination protein RecT|nr:recombinase RecT [Candidatus Symbiothrix sp.]
MNNVNDKVNGAIQQATSHGSQKPTIVQKVAQSGSLAGLNQGEIGQYLSGMKDRVAQVLPKHLTADRVLQMAASTIYRNPAIAKCTPASLLGSVMQASILGFPPVDVLGYCYFVPYGKDVQFQIGYKGYIELARRSGKIKMVYAEVVREGDEFNAAFGLNPTIEHKPKFDSSKPITHVYAVCHFNDGGYNFVVLSKSEVERLRMRSPMQKGNPVGAWATDYDAMAKAKALKQLSKYLPLNIDQAEAIATDEAILKPENFQNGQAKIEDIAYDEATVVDTETGEIKEKQEAPQGGNKPKQNSLL